MTHSKLLLSSALCALVLSALPLSSAKATEGYPGLVDFEASNFPTPAPTNQTVTDLQSATTQKAQNQVSAAMKPYNDLQAQKKALQSQLSKSNNPTQIANLQKQIKSVDAKMGDALKSAGLKGQKPSTSHPTVLKKMAERALPVSKKSIGTRSQRDIQAYQARQNKMAASLKSNPGKLLKMPSLNVPKLPAVNLPNTPSLNLPSAPSINTPNVQLGLPNVQEQ